MFMSEIGLCLAALAILELTEIHLPLLGIFFYCSLSYSFKFGSLTELDLFISSRLASQ